MKTVNATVLSGSDAASLNGEQIASTQLVSASFQAVFADDTAAGTIQVQASNDLDPPGGLSTNFVVTDWSDVPNGSATVTAGVAPIIILPQICYRWLRVTFTEETPGTSTFKVNMFAFGV